MAIAGIASNLTLGPDGFWTAGSVSEVSYRGGGSDRCFAVEDESFWYRHRNACILEAVRRFPPSGAIFDIGGGNGFVTKALEDNGCDAVLVEPRLEGVLNAANRGVQTIIHATLDDAQFLPGRLPAAGLFDVLEHIPDDRAFLATLNGLLIPGGRLYLTVPAHTWLWSHDDADAGHFRRYSLSSLTRTLDSAGFDVELAAGIFAILPLPLLFLRALPYRLGSKHRRTPADHRLTNPAIARAVGALLRLETDRIQTGRALPFGATCLAVARKRALRS